MHPKGSSARVLLTSVFGPYAQDDEFGSRAINPMELYHNQVTRAQGAFSLRMFHRSWGIMMIQENIGAPAQSWIFPRATSSSGNWPPILRHRRHHLDHPERGQGAGDVPYGPRAFAEGPDRRWRPRHRHSGYREDGRCRPHRARRRHLLDAPLPGRGRHRAIRHPRIVSGFGRRTMGMRIPRSRGADAATMIPSVGCPMGCNFCTTSAFFGGKGKFLNFFETGDELFDVMCGHGIDAGFDRSS